MSRSQTIPLVANTIEYALDSEFIDVFAVEFAADGSTYDYYLKPATLDDLDMISLSWRDDGGTRPDYYCLVGAPGTPTSTILIHRKMTSVDAQTIRVWGHRVGATTTTVPDDVQRAAHVPYVMAMLKAGEDPREAAMWYGRFINGCEEVSRRTVSRYAAGFMNVDVGY